MTEANTPPQPDRVLALSGPTAAGKTTIARALAEALDGRIYSSYPLMTGHAQRVHGLSAPETRHQLDQMAEKVEQISQGGWLAKEIAHDMRQAGTPTTAVVDSLRSTLQLSAMRTRFPHKVVHIHLTAPKAELARRYNEAREPGEAPYEEAICDSETRLPKLGSVADMVLDTEAMSTAEIVEAVRAELARDPKAGPGPYAGETKLASARACANAEANNNSPEPAPRAAAPRF